MHPVEDLADRLCKSAPVGLDPVSIIAILVEILSSCKKESARKAMLIADKRPNGMVARTIKRIINERLPAALKNQVAVDMVMLTTCKAAHDEGLWDVVYEFRNLQVKDSGEESNLSAMREFDEVEGDRETHLS